MHRAFKMEWSDVQVVTLAGSATFLIEDEDDMVVCNGIKLNLYGKIVCAVQVRRNGCFLYTLEKMD